MATNDVPARESPINMAALAMRRRHTRSIPGVDQTAGIVSNERGLERVQDFLCGPGVPRLMILPASVIQTKLAGHLASAAEGGLSNLKASP